MCTKQLLSRNHTRSPIRKGRSVSLLSQLFGDGEEILRLEGTLAEAITRFNQNFKKEEIKLLERASFHQTDCKLSICELEIHAELKEEAVWIHKKIVTLKPTKNVMITCAAASPTEISKWHNVIAVEVLLDNFIIHGQSIQCHKMWNSY